jgi:hypothetical protein
MAILAVRAEKVITTTNKVVLPRLQTHKLFLAHAL